MKIDYTIYPVLKIFNKNETGKILLFEEDVPLLKNKWLGILKEITNNIPNFSNEIFFISNPFEQAMIVAREKLMKLFIEITSGDGEFAVNCTYIGKGACSMIHYEKFKNNLKLDFYQFDNDGVLFAYANSSGNSNSIENYWVTPQVSEHLECKPIEWLKNIMANCLLLSLFKKYASVETKELLPYKPIRDVNCQYVNYTKLPITYLDSKWFTTLVKSEGFKVRGHFRLQPKKKDGELIKELIWINDFDKFGYTSPARKLTNEKEEA